MWFLANTFFLQKYMVLVHIICKHQQQCDEIIEFLLEKKLVLDAWVSEKSVFMNRADQYKGRKKRQILIMCKTKALLFNAIDEALSEKYPKNMPTLYCVPIIYMNPLNTLRQASKP